jgi:hypothetical protein
LSSGTTNRLGGLKGGMLQVLLLAVARAPVCADLRKPVDLSNVSNL